MPELYPPSIESDARRPGSAQDRSLELVETPEPEPKTRLRCASESPSVAE